MKKTQLGNQSIFLRLLLMILASSALICPAYLEPEAPEAIAGARIVAPSSLVSSEFNSFLGPLGQSTVLRHCRSVVLEFRHNMEQIG